MAAVPHPLLDATVAFLRRHAPFDAMSADDVRFIAGRAKLGYYPRETLVVGIASGTANTLYLIQRGVVHGRPDGGGDRRDWLEFGEGEAFPITAVLGGRPTTLDYWTHEDTFTYEFDATSVDELARRSHVFQRFCTRHMDQLLQQARSRLRETFTENALGDQAMGRALGSVVRKAPVTCLATAPLREALELMVRHQIGSVVVVDGDRRPQGLLTERAIVRHLSAGSVAIEAPVERFMLTELVTLPASALLWEAAVAMARRSSRYVVVTDDGRLAGIVSERDMFALQRLTMGQVTNAIGSADDLPGLQAAAGEIRKLARSLLAQGLGAEQLTQLISALNDKLTQRILDLECARHDIGGLAVCWIALGSEGRHEQTFSTDQDNAIVFEAQGDAVDALRPRLLAFARAVNETLDACGFPLCKGEVMASNPALCLTLAKWQQRFASWIRSPTPEALLNATIYFDFRAIWSTGDRGAGELADRLRDWLMAQVADQRLFLRMMAENALTARPPLGFFGDIVTSGEADARGTVDLKAQGTRIFIDAVRIHALARGVTATNTAARIRAVGEAMGVKGEIMEAAVDAFHFLLMLRLRHQEAIERGEAPPGSSPNRVDPRRLNDLDRRILKEALRQAASVQARLKLDYQL